MEYKSENKMCQSCKKDFTIEPEDFKFYEKISVPAPTFCPLCRVQRRFAWRNERKLSKVKDFFTQKDIFSLIPTESNKKIITQEEWHGDNWNGMDYGKDYDFSCPFFEQFFELSKEIPIYNLNVQFMVNSPYSGNATGLKNCYLCFNSNHSEDCMYGNAVDKSKDCIDDSHINHSERCYESFWLQDCYQCYFTVMTGESHDMWFCRNCLGCNNCFGCANLRKASYCIFNKKYSKEEYEKELEKMKLNTIKGIKEAREKARKFWLTQPTKSQHGLRNLNSFGSHVTECKNVKDSFLIRESENLRYCQYMQVPGNKDCYDTSIWGEHMELDYETCLSGEYSYNLKFCCNCWPSCKNLEYCLDMFSSTDCFGCVGLKKKQYCVFNKQYTKKEYEILVQKIKKQMNEKPYINSQGVIYRYGEFFPIEFSYYGYNNTIAIQHFPITKEQAQEKKYPWIEIPKGDYEVTVNSNSLPDSIEQVKNNILEDVIECRECKSPYRIMENELIFLRKERIPLPDLCIDCRYDRRIKDRLKLKLCEQKCMCNGKTDGTGIYKNTVEHFHGDKPCEEKFKTGHAPENKEIVYCEKCYQQEVY